MGFCFQKSRQNFRTRFLYLRKKINRNFSFKLEYPVFQNAFFSDFAIITALESYVFQIEV